MIEKEDIACARWAANRRLTQDIAIRTYCLARTGQWDAAVTTFYTGVALGDITPELAALLPGFLDPDLVDDTQTASVNPKTITPLEFRLRAATGQPIPTQGLPLGYAVSDLQKTVGWRSELEAAERLAREGVIGANLLLGVYTRRQASASGGVWDRVITVQKLDHALADPTSTRIGQAMQNAWTAMLSADLAPTLARLFGPKLATLSLEAKYRNTQTAIANLAGLVPIGEHATTDLGSAIISGADLNLVNFATGSNPKLSQALITGLTAGPKTSQRPGTDLLQALTHIERAWQGDMAALGQGLQTLVGLGQSDLARAMAVELLVLDATQ